jgi:hypothetical protein
MNSFTRLTILLANHAIPAQEFVPLSLLRYFGSFVSPLPWWNVLLFHQNFPVRSASWLVSRWSGHFTECLKRYEYAMSATGRHVDLALRVDDTAVVASDIS